MSLFARVQTPDVTLQRLQENVSKAVDPIVRNPVTNGNVLTGVIIGTGGTSVSHKLGRPLLGWMVVRQRAQADVWDEQDDNDRPELTLDLKASATVTVDLYVF